MHSLMINLYYNLYFISIVPIATNQFKLDAQLYVPEVRLDMNTNSKIEVLTMRHEPIGHITFDLGMSIVHNFDNYLVYIVFYKL